MRFKPTTLTLLLLLAAVPLACAQGTGLTGKYYTNTTFSGTAVARTDTNINFTWPGSPVAGVDSNNFSVAWAGQIEPEFTELYTFYLTADDAARLWVDDQLLVGRAFFQGNGEMRGQMRLKAGHRVNLRVEFIEFTGNAGVKLEWASPSRAREVVPMARLYPTQEIPNGGALMMEIWTNLAGASLATLTNSANYPSKPAMREFITSFECLATNWESSYGTRVTGFLRAPTNGNYSFAVSGDDVAQLFLSPSTNAAAKALIASVTNATAFREWVNHPNQISAPIALAAGQRCYVELLHKQNTNADHWSVGWKPPGDTNFSIVPGTVLMQPGVDTAQPATANFFNTLATEQPRLGASRCRFTWLKQQYQSTNATAVKSRAQAVVSQANSDLTAALTTQRAAQDIIQRLAVAWWLTGNTNYAEAAWNQISNSIVNGDWTDPWKGVEDGVQAIGYDWLYPYWSQARKDAMTNAMVVKGFNPGWTDSYGNNIGVIINAGHLLATLAVGTANESVAESKLGSAVGRLNNKIDKWDANAGAWYEGTDYGIFTKWGLGPGMNGMETALGSTWGLSRIRGVSTAAREPLYIASNTRTRFTFSDIGTGSEVAMGWETWWAHRFNAPEGFDWSRQIGNSPFNALLVPETTVSPPTTGLPLDCAFRGPADSAGPYFQEVVTLRENWSDTKATFVGGMGGTYFSHGMLQSGTFQISARGQQWFINLSSEDYGVPNHNVTTPSSGRDRWDYYRNRAEGHNTLVINPNSGPDRIWNAPYAPLINYQSAANGQRSFAVWDLTPTISGVTRVQRGIALLNQRHHLLVQDEIVTPTNSTVWWFAHYSVPSTTVAISGDGTSVTLTKSGERLWAKIVSGGGVFTTRPAEPLPTSPWPPEAGTNSGANKLAIQLTGVTNTTLAVWFVPLAPGENPPTNSPALTPLNFWNLVAQNEAPAARNGVATSTNNAPVDVDLRNLASDDWTYPNHLAFAVSNAQGGSVTLLGDGHTARFTLLTNFAGDVSFDFTATDEGALTSSPATVTIGVSPVTYVWTNLTGGNWSAGANWNNGIAPLSSHGTHVEFFSGAALAGVTLTAINDVANPVLLNSLTLGGTSANTNVIALTGAPLTLAANGFTPPSVTLAASTAPVSYTVSNALTLVGDTTFFANNSGTFNFAGPIGGPGGLTRSNTVSTLILSGNNSYAGPTVIAGGTLQIGNNGASGTLGSADVVNNSTLRLARSGTLTVANDISGTGAVTVAGPTTNDFALLTGDNTFTGTVTVSSGNLRISDGPQLGTGPKSVTVAGAAATLCLDGSAGGVTLPANFSVFTSSPSGNGAILNEAGDNTIAGNVTLTSGAGSTRLTVANGTLTILGNVAPNATGRSLDLRGTANGCIFGNVTDGAGANTLSSLAKNDAGSWTLYGSNTYTGPTTVSGGSLVIDGSLTSPANVTVATSGRLAGGGTIAATTAVLGQLAPGDRFGTMTFASNLTFGSASHLQWELGSNSLASADRVAATSVTVTNGAKVDVLLNSPGSAANFLHAFWRTNRSWPVLNATALTGTFALGTNSTDAGGRTGVTYGAFSVTNTATNVSLFWTALPGFPVINDPTVTITTPATNPASFTLGGLPLNLAATVNSGGGTNFGVNWTYVSDAGGAIFANAAATNTTVQFSDAGEYRLRCSVTNEVGFASADLTVFVMPAPTWFETSIAFTNYSRTESLTNFPVLVVLGTNVPGFQYLQFQTPDGSDLRFLDADGETELNYEIETWNTNGSSLVWVQVPLFTNHCSILARWGDPAVTDPPASAGTGATWSEGYVGVWHLAETNGAHYDSSPNMATSRVAQVTAQGTAAGIVGGGDDFDGVNDFVSLPDMGTNARVTVECWVFLNATPGGGDIGLVSSDPWSAGITHFKTSSSLQIKAQINGAGTVNSANNLLSVSNWFYAAYTIAGGGAADFKTWLNATLIGSATGSTNNILTDVNLAREYGSRYLNARVDEVRISEVPRSSNWLWATYANIASNSWFNNYGSVVVPVPSNQPPLLAVIGNQVALARQTLWITNAATDPDVPAQVLTFSLLSGPTNAAIAPGTGVFQWTPLVEQANTTNLLTVRVADNGLPSLSATQSYYVAVPAAAQLGVPGVTNGRMGIAIRSGLGQSFTIQANTNLGNSLGWTNVFTTNNVRGPFTWSDTNTSKLNKRFYRVIINQ